MSAKINDGGPAFPVYTHDMPLGDNAGPGMTLRDWFAGQALAGMASVKIDLGPCHDFAELEARMSLSISRVGALAYAFADALLAARERGR